MFGNFFEIITNSSKSTTPSPSLSACAMIVSLTHSVYMEEEQEEKANEKKEIRSCLLRETDKKHRSGGALRSNLLPGGGPGVLHRKGAMNGRLSFVPQLDFEEGQKKKRKKRRKKTTQRAYRDLIAFIPAVESTPLGGGLFIFNYYYYYYYNYSLSPLTTFEITEKLQRIFWIVYYSAQYLIREETKNRNYYFSLRVCD